MRKLAADIGMSEANLHRCVNNNKIQAADLEKLAELLGVDIRVFFDGIQPMPHNTIETSGDFSPASIHGDAIANVSGGNALFQERIKHLEELLAEKERLINVLMNKQEVN